MRQEYHFLLHEDITSIPGGMVRERRDMLLHLRSIHTIGYPADGMSLQELVYMLKEQQWLYPKHYGMYWDKRMTTLLMSGNHISMMSEEKLRCIVTAGFFHSGVGATLTCYHCGCNAVDWQADDDPLLRHLELQPNCPVIKGNVLRHQDGGRPSCSIIRRSISCPETAVCMAADTAQ